MKNVSIRVKLTAWYALVLVLMVAGTSAVMLMAGRTVLRRTLREYLVSAVEENADKIRYSDAKDADGVYANIPCKDGWLLIDLDFIESVHDVKMALFGTDGTLLYGENPLAKQVDAPDFTVSRMRTVEAGGIRYDLYDRALPIELPDGGTLWLRGVVSEENSSKQLLEMTRLFWLFLPVILAASVGFGYLLAGRLLSPIRKIEETAEKIAHGEDLGRRIDVGKNRDEIGRLAMVFNAMLDRLQASFERERRFTSDASHELRTPLSVLQAQTEYILEKERTVQDYIEAMEVVHEQGLRMNTLVSDMLDYTRLEQGEKRYPFSKIHLSQVVRQTAAEMETIAGNGITTTVEVDDQQYVNGNEMLLERLIRNLISNAYRYGKENGRVGISLKADGETAVLAVSDDGAGIAAEDQERIFERFYRADQSRSEQGTGLGLSMVKKIAKLHGAQIEVESRPGEGSTFRVVFPALKC